MVVKLKCAFCAYLCYLMLPSFMARIMPEVNDTSTIFSYLKVPPYNNLEWRKRRTVKIICHFV